MQDETKEHTPSLEPNQNPNHTPPSQIPSTPLPGAPSWNIYHNIIDCSLAVFMSVTIDKNLSALIISGYPPIAELVIACNKMIEQFADEMGDQETRLYNRLYAEINSLNIDYEIIETLVPLLRRIYYKPFCDKLNEILKHDFDFDYTDQEDYQDDLDRCMKRAKSILISRDMKKLTFEQIEKDSKGGQPATKENYLGMLLQLSEMTHYHLAPGDITAWEYCQLVKKWNRICKAGKNPADHGK